MNTAVKIEEPELFQSLAGVVTIIEWEHPRDNQVWRSIRIETGANQKLIRVAGFFERVFPGETVKASGEFMRYSGSGDIFVARHVKSFQPTDAENTSRYLIGITEHENQHVRRMVRLLGPSPSEMLNGPETAIWPLMEGIPEDIVRNCISEWKARVDNQYIMELAEKVGIPTNDLQALKCKLSPTTDIDTALKENPFLPYYLKISSHACCLKLAWSQGMTNSSAAVFCATLFRALWHEVMTTRVLYHDISKIFDKSMKSLRLAKNSDDYINLKECLIPQLKQFLNDQVAWHENKITPKACMDAEITIQKTIAKNSTASKDVFAEFDHNELSDLCHERMHGDITQPIYTAITRIKNQTLNIINCHAGITMEPLTQLINDLVHASKHHSIVISPSLKSASAVTSRSNSESSVWTYLEFVSNGHKQIEIGQGPMVCIITHCHIYGLINFSELLSLLPSGCAVIILGDTSQPLPEDLGNPFNDLMQDFELIDSQINTKKEFQPVTSLRSKFVRELESGSDVTWEVHTDIKEDLMISGCSKGKLKPLCEKWYGPIAEHLGITPHKGLNFITNLTVRQTTLIDDTGGDEKSLSKHMERKLYLNETMKTGQIRALENINSIGLLRGCHASVKAYKGEHAYITAGDIEKTINIQDLKYIEFSPFHDNTLSIIEPTDIRIIVLQNGGEIDFCRRDIISWLSLSKVVVITGDISEINKITRNHKQSINGLKLSGLLLGMADNNLNAIRDRIIQEPDTDIINFE